MQEGEDKEGAEGRGRGGGIYRRRGCGRKLISRSVSDAVSNRPVPWARTCTICWQRLVVSVCACVYMGVYVCMNE
jgi:hypothetical protein